ncbi:rhodanese-like domain-containing protein [Atopomonas sediminilitoris]|uniref:rhodanese-like domain-containing protein n=1 Tax=Atopomonas sediminilitoris TaxID=2919919 RepID=UPI001F4ECAC6|nr:rhodanese-like domain-containing protein [Atopomonas sediminilitoris]MCJ8168395.1 rhodanese-like domain-containing protein [Atopomonas sediminilitoris]
MVSQLIEFVANHYILSSAFVALLCLFALNEMRRSGRSLTSRELTALVNQETGIVLDVRAKKDFAAGHIVDALHMPHDKVATQLDQLEKHKGKTLIVVDESGMHAGGVCGVLKKAGFDVAKLSGGIASWRADSLPLVK